MSESGKWYIKGPVKIEFARSSRQPRNPYYEEKAEMKRVAKQEFDEWLRAYPRPLEVNVNATCDPPNITYNDFMLADRWPYSIVAATFAYDDDPTAYYYVPESERHYSVMSNYETVFASKTNCVDHNSSFFCEADHVEVKPEDVVFSMDNVRPYSFSQDGEVTNDP